MCIKVFDLVINFTNILLALSDFTYPILQSCNQGVEADLKEVVILTVKITTSFKSAFTFL